MPAITDDDIDRMRDQLFFDGDDVGRKLSKYWLLLVLSAVIASAGVIADSTATVIGAMIVAPLMVPILGTVVAIVLADRDNLVRSAVLVVGGAAAVVGVGYLLGLITGREIVAAANTQVASRVSPQLIDLVAALATGAVGSVALARRDISDALPGVAIAISLVPPLAVVGLTLESGAPDEAIGSLLLFMTNVSAILASGLVVMGIYQAYRHIVVPPEGVERVLRRGPVAFVVVASLVLIAAPLTVSSVRITNSLNDESTITRVADDWARAGGWDVVGVSQQSNEFVVRATGPEPAPDTTPLQSALADAGVGDVAVRVELIAGDIVTIRPRAGGG